MKKFFKFGCLGFIGIIAIFVIIAVASGGDETETENSATEDTSQTESNDNEGNTGTNNNSNEDNTEPAEDDSTINGEEFDQLSTGMTYEEVVEVIGGEGTVQSETGEEGSQFHTVIYSWEGASGWGANAMVTFQGGKLQSKAQAGVGDGSNSDVTITAEEFNQIENGMTTNQVFEIIGGKGEVTSQTGEKGSQYYTVTYTYYGESGLGSNAILMFQGGKLASKSQFGLE